MSLLAQIYKSNLALLTDFYQLTMAQGYFSNHMHNRMAAFHLYFRQNPFEGGFTIASGLEYVIDFLNTFKFEESDIEYLRSLKNKDNTPCFQEDFLSEIQNLKFSCSVHAIPEGTVVFPHEPMVRVVGPLMQVQLLETTLLNFINFNSLIATKAARMVQIAGNDPVLEFGLRRAQGVDGALSASRAAYIGGCSSTSHTLAGKLFGIPVSGTHAHSWVMSFDNEQEAFKAYAKSSPSNAVFLVDTYDTLEGVKNAIEVGKLLRNMGKNLVGIRLDSGDLAYLSIEARALLDEAGFNSTQIIASNDLNEKIISSLKSQGAQINVWGVGTQLVTAYDQPALGAVYKLAALQNEDGTWEHRIKVSDNVSKISTPGLLQVVRFSKNNRFVADMIFDELTPIKKDPTEIVDPIDPTRFKIFDDVLTSETLLVPIFDKGTCVYTPPSLNEIRSRVKKQINALHPTIKRVDNPHSFPAGLERNLYDLKMKLIKDKKNRNFQK